MINIKITKIILLIMALTNIPVTIGKGQLSKVITKLTKDASNGVYFGYDDTLNSGVVVAGGKLVSSKILDISVSNSDTSTGVNNIEITYLDVNTKTKKTLEFDVINYDGVNSLISSIIFNEDSSVSKIIDTLSSTDFITTDENNNSVSITPITDETTGITTYSISVNTDDESVFINNEGQLTTNLYSLVKSTAVTNPNNAAEYIFTTKHGNGEADDSVTIEIPIAQAIKTANLTKYILGKNLSDSLKELIDGEIKDDAYYEYNIDNNIITEIDELPNNVIENETYIHFIWGGEATPTFLNVADIAVNYAGSEYISIDSNTISLNYSSLISDISTDLGIENINSSINDIKGDIENIDTSIENINSSINDIKGDIENIDTSINNLVTSISTNAEDISNIQSGVTNINTSINDINKIINGSDATYYTEEEAAEYNEIHKDDEGFVEVNAGDIKDASVDGLNTLSDKIEAINQLFGDSDNNINNKLETIDSSIDNITINVSNIDSSISGMDTSIQSLNDIINKGTAATYYTEEEANALNSAAGLTEGDEGYIQPGSIKNAATPGLVEKTQNLDTSINNISNTINTVNTSINNIYELLTWIDLDAI